MRWDTSVLRCWRASPGRGYLAVPGQRRRKAGCAFLGNKKALLFRRAFFLCTRLGLHQGFSRVMVYHTRSSKPGNASSPETGTGAASRCPAGRLEKGRGKTSFSPRGPVPGQPYFLCPGKHNRQRQRKLWVQRHAGPAVSAGKKPGATPAAAGVLAHMTLFRYLFS